MSNDCNVLRKTLFVLRRQRAVRKDVQFWSFFCKHLLRDDARRVALLVECVELLDFFSFSALMWDDAQLCVPQSCLPVAMRRWKGKAATTARLRLTEACYEWYRICVAARDNGVEVRRDAERGLSLFVRNDSALARDPAAMAQWLSDHLLTAKIGATTFGVLSRFGHSSLFVWPSILYGLTSLVNHDGNSLLAFRGPSATAVAADARVRVVVLQDGSGRRARQLKLECKCFFFKSG